MTPAAPEPDSADAPRSVIDWEFAAKVGARTVAASPSVTPREADAVVAELRAGAERSTDLVHGFTGLHAAGGTAPVLVVDRPGWVEANVQSFATLMDPVVDRIASKAPTSGIAHAVGSRVTGAEVGALLGFLGSKVLGQFDPFHGETGRLLLVAPNVVHVERELEVDPADFRLWVCLHEETHRVQFTAVPWLRDHVRSLVGDATEAMDPGQLAGDLLQRITELVRGEGSEHGITDLFASPAQREVIDRITAVMSLLEGHADVVMDGVGPEVIGSVAQIRKKFNSRRAGASSIDRLVRRLLGLEAKMAQYRNGAVFVREVVDTVGMDGFNAVFTEAETLPSKAEIHDPAAWVRRVHG